MPGCGAWETAGNFRCDFVPLLELPSLWPSALLSNSNTNDSRERCKKRNTGTTAVTISVNRYSNKNCTELW